ncbi:hypothetical protein PMAYCL1PPCAC_11379, partial [Pristionchus mayeri]
LLLLLLLLGHGRGGMVVVGKRELQVIKGEEGGGRNGQRRTDVRRACREELWSGEEGCGCCSGRRVGWQLLLHRLRGLQMVRAHGHQTHRIVVHERLHEHLRVLQVGGEWLLQPLLHLLHAHRRLQVGAALHRPDLRLRLHHHGDSAARSTRSSLSLLHVLHGLRTVAALVLHCMVEEPVVEGCSCLRTSCKVALRVQVLVDVSEEGRGGGDGGRRDGRRPAHSETLAPTTTTASRVV